MNIILLGAPFFPDPDTNEPIANGTLYVGEPDLDPTVEGNRITVYLIQQDGTQVEILPAAQPLTIGPGGVVMYEEAPAAQLWVETNYSMTVLRADETQAYYFPNAGIPDLISNLQDSSYWYLTDVAGTNVITADATPSLSAYAVGQKFHFLPANANTGAVTLNINGLGAGNVLHNGAALGAGDLGDGIPAEVVVTSVVPTFELLATATAIIPSTLPASPIPIGTHMVFMQNTVPDGWAFVASNDDRVLLNTDTESEGGDTGGSWTISGVTVDGTTLTGAQSGIAAHAHVMFKNGDSGNATLAAGQTPAQTGSFGSDNEYKIGNFGTTDPDVGETGTVAAANAAESHTHGLTADGAWRPAYVKVITAEYIG